MARHTPDKHLGLFVRPGREGEDALGIRALVLIRCQHFVQTIMPKLRKEPLDVHTRKPTQGIKAKGCVFAEHRSIHLWAKSQLGAREMSPLRCTHLFRSQLAFLQSNLLGFTLQLWKIK